MNITKITKCDKKEDDRPEDSRDRNVHTNGNCSVVPNLFIYL